MINLLSRDEQKKIYREYLLRIGTLVSFVVTVVGLVFIGVLVPSYMRLLGEIDQVNSQLASKQAQMEADDQGQIKEAKEFVSEIQVLHAPASTSSITSVIDGILLLKPARVGLLQVQYEKTGGKTNLGIHGKADRREDLLEFKESLERKGGFNTIDIPAQTLIKRTDILFSMDLSGVSIPDTPSTPSQIKNPGGDESIPFP